MILLPSIATHDVSIRLIPNSLLVTDKLGSGLSQATTRGAALSSSEPPKNVFQLCIGAVSERTN